MFKSVGHFFASVFKGVVKVFGVATTPEAFLGGLTPLQVGEKVAAVLNPNSAVVLNGAMALLGEFASLYSDGKLAVKDGFVNFTLDEATFRIAEQAVSDAVAFFKNPVKAPAKG